MRGPDPATPALTEPRPAQPPARPDSASTPASDLLDSALVWWADDPDEATRAELRAVLDALPDSGADLADRFAGPLTFGTAGLRGPLRAGPNGMNTAVVRAAAAGLVHWLDTQGVPGPVVIGYDARHGSHSFATQTAQVVTGAGREALLLPRPLPTPVLAHAVRLTGAVAGVMVTASHNPPQDNGYKVYLGAALGGELGAGAQIVPPVDAQIEAAIRVVGPLRDVPLGGPGLVLGEEVVTGYLAAVAAVVGAAVDPAGRTAVDPIVSAAVDPAGRTAVDPAVSTIGGEQRRGLTVAYTPLHGVGGEVFAAALAAAGFAPPSIVAEQAEPDPDFPTVAFPNPEEPGAMDLVLALAAAGGADLAIANDPDADRCAVAVPTNSGWRMLRGDEVGILLADHLIRRDTPGVFATTIVSSSMLRAVCAKRGRDYAETLTGFKWIVRAGARLAFGYEEALGYCVAPEVARDKDGISAALVICELAAELKARSQTLSDRLDELAAEFGVYATDQLSIRVTDLARIDALMANLRARPPVTLLDEVATVQDLAPDADVLILRAGQTRVVVRPSGTEPKLKAYLEVVEPVPDGAVPPARERAAVSLAALRTEVESALAI